MSVLPVGIAASGDVGYTLDNSLRFRSSASAYLTRTPSSAGNRKTFTISFWHKKAKTAGFLFAVRNSSGGAFFALKTSSDTFNINDSQNSDHLNLTTTQVFRDVSAWYHIVVAIDTTQATSSNRAKLYVNGEQVTSFSTSSYPAQNADMMVNSTIGHYIGCSVNLSGTPTLFIDAYLTEINFIDGQALDPTDFGEFDETTGVWKPKEYTGTYGTNGFYLPTTATTQAEGFNTVTYTGNGTSQSISDVGFSPDLVWIKNRSAAQHHNLFDSVRGAGKLLYPNLTNAEATSSTHLNSFDSDGFTVGSATSANGSGNSIVAWCWDAGSGSPVSNTQGTIPSTVKANTTQGFSIVSYTGNATAGATVGHGLTSAPEMVLVKRRDSTGDWLVWNETIASSNSANVLFLNATAGATSNSSNFNSTAPTSSVFTVGNNPATNSSGGTHIAYCWHSVAGYSDIGTYTGTGSSGKAVTTGFRPAFLIIKSTGATATGWIMVDNTRDPDNLASEYIYADSSAAEATYTNILEFTDTGFELIIGAGSAVNQSGVNYIYMAFADTRDAQFNFDASGNKNNWIPNNINSNASSEASFDIMTDVPTLTDEYTANYCTLNNIKYVDNSPTYSYANLRYSTGSSWSTQTYIEGTIGPLGGSTGKYYWEVSANYTADYYTAGVALQNNTIGATNIGTTGSVMVYYASKYVNGTATSSYITPVPANGVLGVALDASNGKVWFRNSSGWGSSGDPAAGTNEAGIISGFSGKRLMPVFQSNLNATVTANFGQRPFAYTPPTGFLPLNTYNLPDSTIEDGSEYMKSVEWTGTTAAQSIDFGMQPDLIWAKGVNSAAGHRISDSVRGGNGTHLYNISSSSTAAENTDTVIDAITSTGIDLGTLNHPNNNGTVYVGWGWKANGSGSSNTVGSIPSTVSANTTAGFSIATYTGNATAGATIGHGLGVTPAMFIIKSRSNAYNWLVYHKDKSLNGSSILILNSTSAGDSGAGYLNNTGPTSSVFTVGGGPYTNGNTLTYVAYCFAPVEGFSSFGSYTGNGNATDGPFIYTGFRPAWIMVKRTNSADNWWMQDNARDPYNVAKHYLSANTNNAEFSNLDVYDYTANGFKIRTTTTAVNASGSTYIYAAFAENPFKNSLAR